MVSFHTAAVKVKWRKKVYNIFVKTKKKKLTADYLKKLKVPKTLVIGLLIASTLGWTGYDKLKDIKSYYDIREIFPVKTKAVQVIDGDTLVMENDLTLRLLGIDAPGQCAGQLQGFNDLYGSIFLFLQISK